MSNIAKHLTIHLVGVLTLAGSIIAQDDGPLFPIQHQAGARFGPWINLGDLPPDSGGIIIEGSSTDGSYSTNIGDASFYGEAFFGYRLSRRFMAELAGGTANRGSVTLADGSGASDIGNLTVYSIMAQLKYYPTALSRSFYPYISGGAAMFIGRRGVQFTNSYYYSNWEEETEVAFSYTLAAGVDAAVADQVALDFQVRYLPVDFGDELMTINDYSAVAVTVGVKYLYSD